MGVVYVAEDLHLGRRVAIKFLHASSSDHHYRARFLREARAISSLSHPHIATVFDYDVTPEGQPFLVMELVEGETLGDLLETSALTLWQSIEIIERVAEALEEAHGRGIVHRDIKPSNVVVTTERAQVKVLDFGLAKRITEENHEQTDQNAQTLLATHTRDGVVVGTPLYLSPEQATGANVDGRSDLFALGALLYECISGKPAFSGGSVIEIGAQVLHIDPPPPSQFNSQVTPELDRITLKALAKKPADRYQTAKEMREDLAAQRMTMSVNGKKIERLKLTRGAGGRTSALNTISTSLRQPRISVFTLVIGVVAIALVFTGIAWLFRDKQHIPTPDAQRLYDTGTNFLREGAYYQASKSLEKAVSLDDRFALAHARLAEAWMELGYDGLAKDEMLRANASVPNRSALTQMDGLYLDAINAVVLNNFASATDFYRRIVEAEPDKPQGYVDLGRAYENNEEIDKALESYLAATNHDSEYATAFLRAAIIYIRKQNVPSAKGALDRAASLYEELGSIEGRTEVLYWRGVLLTDTGNLQDARVPLQQALDMTNMTGNEPQKIKVLLQLSRLSYNEGAPARARDYADTALAFAEQKGLHNLAIIALLDLGNAFSGKNEYEQAVVNFRRALDLAQRVKAQKLEALSMMNLGGGFIQQLRTDEGLPLIDQAYKYFQQGNYQKQISICLTYLGRIYRNKGRYDEAMEAFRRKLQSAETSGDQRQAATAYGEMAMALARQERYPEALKIYHESYMINKRLNFRQNLAYNRMNNSSVLWQLGRYEEARASLAEASQLASQSKDSYPAVLAEIQMIEAQIALSERRFPEAKQISERAIKEAGASYLDVSFGAKITLGLAQAFSGQAREAKRTCEEALAMAERTGEDALISEAMLALAEALYESGDHDGALTRALTVRERLARSGEQESQWRVWLLAARISLRKGETAAAQEQLARANDALLKLQTQWGAEAFDRYQSRKDILFLRKQLSEALVAVP